MSIDLSRVNVSLQQFQSISSGKYNAGEVRLESETTLGKINHHVHFRGSNAKSISHAEVLAVKNAFVKALSEGGVGADEIAQIRRDLGLAAESGADKSLHERSLRPLTRQQVRQILDRNPPEPSRLRGAYDLIPDAVRPNLSVASSFDILNA